MAEIAGAGHTASSLLVCNNDEDTTAFVDAAGLVPIGPSEVERELPPGAGERMIEQAHAAAASATRISRAVFDNACGIIGIE